MSQNPYSADYMSGGQVVLGERKMSILAVTSLVFGILALPMCCVMMFLSFSLAPALGGSAFIIGALPGVLAITLAIAAIVQIRGSNGTRGGMGLAITGLVLGLLSAVLWTALIIGGNSLVKTIVQGANWSVTQVGKGDVGEVRKLLTPNVSSSVSDADITSFCKELKDRGGDMTGISTNLGDLIHDYSVFKNQQAFQSRSRGQQTIIPLPIRMSKQNGMAFFDFDQTGGGQGPMQPNFQGVLNDLIIELDDGAKLQLVQPSKP